MLVILIKGLPVERFEKCKPRQMITDRLVLIMAVLTAKAKPHQEKPYPARFP